jgi:1,4-alpha-glucan branching enzyme
MSSQPFRQVEYGRWELVLHRMEGKTAIQHGDNVKLLVNDDDCVSLWASFVIQPVKYMKHEEGVACCHHFF